MLVGWALPTVPPGAEARVGGQSPPYNGSLGAVQSIATGSQLHSAYRDSTRPKQSYFSQISHHDIAAVIH
jgi:hypothetical protein